VQIKNRENEKKLLYDKSLAVTVFHNDTVASIPGKQLVRHTV
jgi:hypothetical protein